MTEVRPLNEEGDRQDERDSQLSAMFDGELSAAECELLARRLTRDDALRAQWSRYSKIGAALRAERGVKLHDRVALRVQVQITQEVSYDDSIAGEATVARAAALVPAAKSAGTASDRWMRFARPMLGAGIAAGVAVMSIVWMQGSPTEETLLASNPVPDTVTLAPETVGTTVALERAPVEAVAPVISNGEPERYSTPAPSSQANLAPNARLANYVVAHSEYSGPLSRRMALLGLVASEGAADAAPSAADPAPAAAGQGAQDDAR
jgi:sigma-E factor negative regulatory protein RseA